MTKTIAVIGAGPSGLVAAKELSAAGLKVYVFEAESAPGGLWREDGYTWRGMRTNVSKWNCSFSDFPWADEAPEFPTGDELRHYLQAYTTEFYLHDLIDYNTRVTSVSRLQIGWKVVVNGQEGRFDGVVVASGVFAKPSIPASIPAAETLIYSSAYRGPADGIETVAVAGGAMSGIEIAAHLAKAGRHVHLITQQPCWILPRTAQLNGEGAHAPLDLLLNRRAAPNAPVIDAQARNRRVAELFKNNFSHTGHVADGLIPASDGSPNYVAISDGFMQQVRAGRITVHNDRLFAVCGRNAVLQQGRALEVDQVIACTGYKADLSFLGEAEQKVLSYKPDDTFLPFIAGDALSHPDLPGLYFVGAYRGPYFGVMELQARVAAAELAGELPLPKAKSAKDALTEMRALRRQQPRPQFPFGYVPLADRLATRLGVLPDIEPGTPITPAVYRLSGPGAAPEKALPAIISASRRMGLN